MMEDWFHLQLQDTKKTKIDGSANLLLYGYGSYGNSMSPGFSSTRFSLIDRDIIWATAHIRGWNGKRYEMVERRKTYK
jgi:protease II